MKSDPILNTIVPYCERLSSTNSHEPFNTITNAAFLIVALYSWHRLRTFERASHQSGHAVTQTRFRLMLLVLCGFPALIGIGSALFHAMPSFLTQMLDIVPVCLFAVCALLLFLTHKQWPALYIATTLLAWIGATAVTAQWPQALAGSLFYLPTVLVLVFLSAVFNPGTDSNSHRHCGQQEKRLLLMSATAFAAALLFRTTDLPTCSPWTKTSSTSVPAPSHTPEFLAGAAGSLGTHFLWHLLTALVCYLITSLLIAACKAR